MKVKIIILILILTLIGLGGYTLNKNKKENYIMTQEKRIDLYFKHNLKNYQTMKINNFKKSPMKGYFIDGYINDDKSLVVLPLNKAIKESALDTLRDKYSDFTVSYIN